MLQSNKSESIWEAISVAWNNFTGKSFLADYLFCFFFVKVTFFVLLHDGKGKKQEAEGESRKNGAFFS